jgi:hypothetical protein
VLSDVGNAGNAASKLISERIAELGDWRGDTLARMRALIREADPDALKDPAKLFNSSLDGNARRAIDIHEGGEIDANAFKALIRAAVALNTAGGKKSTKRK